MEEATTSSVKMSKEKAVDVDAGMDYLAANVVTILFGLRFGNDCGLLHFCVESDAANVVRLINDGNHLNSSCANIVSDILGFMSEMGISSVSSGRKGANKAASFLARQALLRKSDVFWKRTVELDLFKIIARGGPSAFMSPNEIASELPNKKK
ncbi:hypothetical protein EZV62_024374 [Acer yangbiense]|uniref:RNase H type-1 domain-containing protein n=1 Tax=Acer yangbiense TaxID=1000413 RepID=A0A5C7GVF4_9ROSI|nr:hypothetical protein EZV62_024374 [Acer yangbiense]